MAAEDSLRTARHAPQKTLFLKSQQKQTFPQNVENCDICRHFYCQLSLRGPADRKVQLVVNQLDIPESDGCHDSVLRVFDGVPGVNGWELGGECAGGKQVREWVG